MRRALDCALAGLLGADADGILNGVNKDFAVADLAGFGGLDDGGGRRFEG